MCTIIAGLPLACDECQDARQKLLASKPETNFASREWINKYMRNGFDQFIAGFKADGETLDTRSGKSKDAVRLADIVFIRNDGFTIGCDCTVAMETYLLHPDKWIAVLQKPRTEPMDPRSWMKEWVQIINSDKPGDLRSKLPKR